MSDEDYSLSILNSNVFYEKLDKAPDYSIYEDDSFWKSHIMNTCIKYTNMFDTILKAFHYVSYLKIKEDIFFHERWNYLYFWVGSKALANAVEACPFEHVISVLKNVREYIQKDTYDYDIEKINSTHFKHLKVIYDYIVNYNSIKLMIGENTNCTRKYKEYVDNSYQIYEGIKAQCQTKEIEPYCKMFNYIAQKNPETILKKLTCNGEMPPLSVKQYIENHLHDTDGDTDLDVQMKDTGASVQMHTGGIYPSSAYDNMMPTFFPILGFFSILFLLYNFTPFRCWLHNIVSKKKNIRHRIYEEHSDEFFESVYESKDTNSQGNRHDISYHSIINS
ncbi:PIR Superfamily Protein [Plasmodium ovale curtisi]|uniref:PIR Superfamily Protein n=1 Tax=Plasmodium ovale curtisi TaxID=864141 RepID=A0A1A8WPF0_PLAOA|nr:PIR Superfamily Protein [Plasmodium ovale curtisi]SBT00211.1 PIR Superfamily Protein [Plasmodium ovale curtisi]